MKTQKLTLNELMQDAEVIEKENLNSIKGGMTAAELLAAIAANGIDKYAGLTYHFGNGGSSDSTGFSFAQSNMAPLIMAGLNFGGGDAIFGGTLNQVKVTGNKQNSCSNCLDPSSIGNNILGLSYPGGNNPLTRSGDYSYSYVPTILSEYPAIGHDRRYDNLGINGALGLFKDPRAIGADWQFVVEELSISANLSLNMIDRMSAIVLGVGLGLSALPKSLYQLSNPMGFAETMMWYNISNQNVNNKPTIHKH